MTHQPELLALSSAKTSPPPPLPPISRSNGPMNGVQIFGIVMICVFFILYVYFIMQMYRASSAESRQKLKSHLKKRMSMIASQGGEMHRGINPSSIPHHRVRSGSVEGRDRARSIISSMTEIEMEVVSAMHVDTPVEVAQSSSPINGIAEDVDAARPSEAAAPSITNEALNEIDMILAYTPTDVEPVSPSESSCSIEETDTKSIKCGSPLVLLFGDIDNPNAKISTSQHTPFQSPVAAAGSLSPLLAPVSPATVPGDTPLVKVQLQQQKAPSIIPLSHYIHCNAIEQLALNNCDRISSVDLSDQLIGREGVTTIARILASPSAAIFALLLKNCELRDFEAALLGRALLRNKTLLRLDLSGNKIRGEGCSVLAAAFGSVEVIGNPKVNSMGINAQRSKFKALNTTLQELYISGNRIGAIGAEFLSNCLKQNASLTVLDVSYQRKSFKIGPVGAHKLSLLLGSSSCKLLTFKCGRNNIGFEGCRHFASALLRNKTLTECDLGGVNYITIAGALQLGQAIKCNHHSALATLVVGEHRIPIQPVIGRTPIARGSIITIYKEENETMTNYRDKAFVATTRHGMDDELAVVLATLVTNNKSLEYLQVVEAHLPIQKLIGNDPVEYLDMTNMKLTSIDAIIIGSLIAENTHLKCIDLKGNCFGGTEGENFVAYALERNTDLELNTDVWSAAQMFSDGYPTLAASLGMSASCVTIEPQRLEGWFYQGLTVLSAILFYVGLIFDITTLYTFSLERRVYFAEWVYLLTLIMCTPTIVFLFNTMRNLLHHNPKEAIIQSVVILFQASPAILAYEAVLASMESAALLDFKFTQSTHKSIPQIYFQTYIMFAVAMFRGMLNYWSLISVLSSLISITVIFIMLFDRKAARRMSMAPLADQPYCAVVVAKIFEFFGMGTTSEEVKAFVNFDAFYTSHYCLSYVYQLAGLCPRIVSIAWLLACENSIYGIITLIISFWVRIVVMCLHDKETFNRSIFNNTIMGISLVISDSAWKFHPAEQILSRDSFISLSFISTAEIFIALYYTYFVFDFTLIPIAVNTSIFILMIFFVALRWVMIYTWALHVHFPRLYLTNSRKGSVVQYAASAVAASSTSSSSNAAAVISTRAGDDSNETVHYAFGWNPFQRQYSMHQ